MAAFFVSSLLFEIFHEENTLTHIGYCNVGV